MTFEDNTQGKKKKNLKMKNKKQFKCGKEISPKSHYEKSCPWRPHYLITRTQKPFKYNCVVIMSSKVQLLCNYTL